MKLSEWTGWLIVGLVAFCPGCSGKSETAKDLVANDVDGSGGGCEEGAECDDLDPCTYNDLCVEGVCKGTPNDCPSYPCADTQCDPSGSCPSPVVNKGWCLIQEQCIEDGEPVDGNPCRICDSAVSTSAHSHAPTGTSCEDGNPCTENDYCDHGDCLPGSPPTCADGILCTIDSCDLTTGCSHELDHLSCMDENPCTRDECSIEEKGCVHIPDDTLVCTDGDVCTQGDKCVSGVCILGESVDCDDNNECTDEICHPSFGCIYTFNSKPCNDGASCTKNDVCHYGICLGEEDWWNPCPNCTVEFGPQNVKFISFRVGKGGHPGEALDVDSDFKSCSPPGDCELGLDNSLSFAGEIIDETLAQNLVAEKDPLIFVASLDNPTSDGSKFKLTLVYAWQTDASAAAGCDHMTQTCTYEAGQLNFDVLCHPQVLFTNATITDGVLKAGGSGFIFPFKMSFQGGGESELVLFSARVQATVETDKDGNVTSLSGVLGGAVTKEDIIETVEAIPAEYFPDNGKDLVLTLVQALPQDIDLDGNGTKDASSISLVFESIPAILEPFVKW